MNKADAKCAACRRAASVIETALAEGWETLDMYGDDRVKVEVALHDLVQELIRRGGVR